LEKTDFKHSTQIRVRSFDVDSQGIVHNAVYLQYFEIGRIEYRRHFGISLNSNGVFSDGMKVVVARNEIDYFKPAFLDDVLSIHTKISWIKNSSFCFEQLITNDSSGDKICECKGILVNLNSDTNIPELLNAEFVKQIEVFEPNLKLIKNSIS